MKYYKKMLEKVVLHGEMFAIWSAIKIAPII